MKGSHRDRYIEDPGQQVTRPVMVLRPMPASSTSCRRRAAGVEEEVHDTVPGGSGHVRASKIGGQARRAIGRDEPFAGRWFNARAKCGDRCTRARPDAGSAACGGARVRVVLTRSAAELVRTALFEALGERPGVELWRDGRRPMRRGTTVRFRTSISRAGSTRDRRPGHGQRDRKGAARDRRRSPVDDACLHRPPTDSGRPRPSMNARGTRTRPSARTGPTLANGAMRCSRPGKGAGLRGGRGRRRGRERTILAALDRS